MLSVRLLVNHVATARYLWSALVNRTVYAGYRPKIRFLPSQSLLQSALLIGMNQPSYSNPGGKALLGH
jgi:hypothetical protein